MTEYHAALISISIELTTGQSKLKEIIDSFGALGNVVETSSIYKRYLNRRMEDLNSELVMVFKLETEKTAEDIFKFLKNQNNELKELDCVLLAYDKQVRLLPGQNLPNPLMHLDGLTLRCASEAWGSYEHPVLGQTLNELVISNQPLPDVDFFAQGRSLFKPE